MSIVMVSNKTKEEILASIKTLLVAEASTEANLKEVKAAAEMVAAHCREQAAKIAEIRVKVESMEDFDRDEKDAIFATRLKKAGLTLEQESVPTVEEVEQFKLAQLVADSAVLAVYEKWSAVFGLESKKAVVKATAGKSNEDVDFNGEWSRSYERGSQIVWFVNYRVLTEEQKTRLGLKNAGEWAVKFPGKPATSLSVKNNSRNGVMQAIMEVLGNSPSINGKLYWTEHTSPLSAEQISSF